MSVISKLQFSGHQTRVDIFFAREELGNVDDSNYYNFPPSADRTARRNEKFDFLSLLLCSPRQKFYSCATTPKEGTIMCMENSLT